MKSHIPKRQSGYTMLYKLDLMHGFPALMMDGFRKWLQDTCNKSPASIRGIVAPVSRYVDSENSKMRES